MTQPAVTQLAEPALASPRSPAGAEQVAATELHQVVHDGCGLFVDTEDYEPADAAGDGSAPLADQRELIAALRAINDDVGRAVLRLDPIERVLRDGESHIGGFDAARREVRAVIAAWENVGITAFDRAITALREHLHNGDQRGMGTSLTRL